MTEEVATPITTLFTEAKLSTFPSKWEPERPGHIYVFYNSQFWDSETDVPALAWISPTYFFKLKPEHRWRHIQFENRGNGERLANNSIPVKNRFLKWVRRGKYTHTIALFYTVLHQGQIVQDRVLAIAAQNLETYTYAKHVMVERYLEWTLTGKLPFDVI